MRRANLSLLPQKEDDFRSKSYWNEFFAQRSQSGGAFEWYGTYEELRTILRSQMKTVDQILVIGCGNSEISFDMHQDGFQFITNIDYSEIVIQEMQEKYLNCAEMRWISMNFLEMGFQDAIFDVCFDKGALDALIPMETSESLCDAEKLFSEISRVLTPGGRYICVTLAQPHVLRKVLQEFTVTYSWNVRIFKLPINENSKHHPFVIVCTKPKDEATSGQIDVLFNGAARRNASIDWVMTQIAEVQELGIPRSLLKQIQPNQQRSLMLWAESGNESNPKYGITIVDRNPERAQNGGCAVFLVPQGREHEWMFSSKEGLNNLSEAAGYERLIVVTLLRGHTFSNTQDVQSELSPHILELVPANCHERIPYLTEGGVGSRTVVAEFTSSFSGRCVIEDVAVDCGGLSSEEMTQGAKGLQFRRLIFLNNPNVIQSEAKMIGYSLTEEKEEEKVKSQRLSKQSKRKQKKKSKNTDDLKWTIDHNHMACKYHKAIIASLCHIPSVNAGKDLNICIIGLGGGLFAMFLRKFVLRDMHMTVLELDSSVAEAARLHFGFEEDETLKVEICDGIEWIKEYSDSITRGESSLLDILVFDVDSKDTSVGMSCPPQEFLEESVLICAKNIIQSGGALIVNVACRNEALYEQSIQKIAQVFSQVLHVRPDDDETNRVVVAFLNPLDRISDRVELCTILSSLVPNTQDEEILELLGEFKLIENH